MRIRFSLLMLVWVASCTALIARAAVAQELARKNAAMDWKAFEGLSEAGKSKFILTALDARDHELANMRYAVRETSVNVSKVSGDRRFMTSTDYELRRLGDEWWMHVKTHDYYNENAPISMDATMNWDGTRGIYSVPAKFAESGRFTGVITATENDNFSYRRLAELLGFRIRLAPTSMPVTQYLREALARRAKLEATREAAATATLMHIVIQDEQWRREIWLDPERGFTTVRIVHVYGKEYMKGTLEVLETQQVAGVWVPKKAITTGTTYKDKEFTEITHEVIDCEIGGMKQRDLAIDFPAGSKVIDNINNVTYIVGVDRK